MQNAIIINNISKSYGKVLALSNINIEVGNGELFGLIGPDGAGKTTLIRILCTLLLADAGSASVIGYDIIKGYKKIRESIGYMPGKFALYQDLTVEENVKLFASIFSTTLEDGYELVKPIYSQIEPFKKRPAGKLSGGMKQKLALTCALIHKPKILFLDEPTTGVDPVSRKEFWDMLRNLKSLGITIFVSTPYMDEASLCDRVALIQEGKILQIESPKEIVSDFPRLIFSIITSKEYQLLKFLRESEFVYSVHPFGDSLHYVDKRYKVSINEIEVFLNQNGFNDSVVSFIEPKIEDCFMELMG
jgi:ABC-2 type transport system ATP-binding protein